ncbi:hypothetical protein GCM10009069_18580 [Algimonas arctica]|uniref:Uncharacterized protein n=1 Tax=Algimonas arctica TaxID=1479486 RepID=A0A8J3G2R0_9PROT|nr:hypothetical protein GCM10009069_18580 [Algimonas arctica]
MFVGAALSGLWRARRDGASVGDSVPVKYSPFAFAFTKGEKNSQWIQAKSKGAITKTSGIIGGAVWCGYNSKPHRKLAQGWASLTYATCVVEESEREPSVINKEGNYVPKFFFSVPSPLPLSGGCPLTNVCGWHNRDHYHAK